MTTNTMTSPPRTNRLHYAWVVLATTTLVLLASGGVRAAIGVFVKPLEAEFGWSRTALSFAVAVSIALYGLTGPFVGRLADRWGPRWVLTGGVALVGIGTMAGAGVTQFWQFFVAVGLIAAIGSSATAAPVAATVATRWFESIAGSCWGSTARAWRRVSSWCCRSRWGSSRCSAGGARTSPSAPGCS